MSTSQTEMAPKKEKGNFLTKTYIQYFYFDIVKYCKKILIFNFYSMISRVNDTNCFLFVFLTQINAKTIPLNVN